MNGDTNTAEGVGSSGSIGLGQTAPHNGGPVGTNGGPEEDEEPVVPYADDEEKQPPPPLNDIEMQPAQGGNPELKMKVNTESELEIAGVIAEGIYTVTLTEKPFGILFGTNKGDKNNLYVQGIDAGSIGDQLGVIVGSSVVKFGEQKVEGLGAKKIFKIFKTKYSDVLPLTVTFKKPGDEEGDGDDDDVIDEDFDEMNRKITAGNNDDNNNVEDENGYEHQDTLKRSMPQCIHKRIGNRQQREMRINIMFKVTKTEMMKLQRI